jgi:hypothetical protein
MPFGDLFSVSIDIKAQEVHLPRVAADHAIRMPSGVRTFEIRFMLENPFGGCFASGKSTIDSI